MIRWSPAAPARPACPHRRLLRLLAAELGDAIALGTSTMRPWASANFVGARHIFACKGECPAGLEARLAAVEWPLRDHIVADLAVAPMDGECDFRIEILTVED